MKTWKLEITVKVAESWIADGFDMRERIEDLESQIRNMLPFAHEHELDVRAKITKSPTATELKALQNGDVDPMD